MKVSRSKCESVKSFDPLSSMHQEGLLGYPPLVKMVPEEGALGHREAVAGREEELLANVDALRI